LFFPEGGEKLFRSEEIFGSLLFGGRSSPRGFWTLSIEEFTAGRFRRPFCRGGGGKPPNFRKKPHLRWGPPPTLIVHASLGRRLHNFSPATFVDVHLRVGAADFGASVERERAHERSQHFAIGESIAQAGGRPFPPLRRFIRPKKQKTPAGWLARRTNQGLADLENLFRLCTSEEDQAGPRKQQIPRRH